MFDINVERIYNSNLTRSARKEFNSTIQKFNPNAFYIAIVEDTKDPYLLGRVRIRIPAIHGVKTDQSYYLPTKSLPWAKPAIFNAGGNDVGQFIVPAVGTRVLVTFEYDSADKPLYFGGIPTLHNKNKLYNDNSKIYDGESIVIDTDDRITDLEQSSAQSVVYKSLKGATIIIDDKDGNENIKIIDASGQVIEMRNDSGQTLQRRGNKEVSGTSGSSINIKTEGAINFTGASFKYNGDDVGTTNGSDKNYYHVQSVASDEWIIKHNLGKYPAVSIIDSAGTQVQGEIKYSSLDEVIIKFSAAFSGKATLN